MWKHFLVSLVFCLALCLPGFSQEVNLTLTEWQEFKKDYTELEKIFQEQEIILNKQQFTIEKLEKELKSSETHKESSVLQLKEAEAYLALSQSELEQLKKETRINYLKVGGISALVGILVGGIATIFLTQ